VQRTEWGPAVTVKFGAIISTCGLYRYSLWRYWGPRPYGTFIMLNPSTADGNTDDATIRRCCGFARAWGWGGFHVYNLFAFRATDPRELWTVKDPIGPRNNAMLEFAIRRARQEAGFWDPMVVAWGAHARTWRVFERAQFVRALAREHNQTLYCLGETADGHPRHPLRLRTSNILTEWTT